MKESESASYDNEVDVWDYIRDNPMLMGLPISETKGIDILAALRDIYVALGEDVTQSKTLLSLLATVLVGAAEGQGKEVMEEVMVMEAMQKLDNNLKGILDEGQ
jgi:hypothetical protein